MDECINGGGPICEEGAEYTFPPRGGGGATIRPSTGEGDVLNGTTLYRVWGDVSGPYGQSWTTVDPGTIPNYRDAAGLPKENTGRFISEGVLRDSSGTQLKNADPLDGNRGGLPEVRVPNPESQIQLRRVEGVNPPF